MTIPSRGVGWYPLQLFAMQSITLPSLALFALALGCSSTPDPWRGCALSVRTGFVPALQRAADKDAPKLAATPHCAVVPGPGLPDEPEAVDDLDALLGRGRVCGPDGQLNPSHPCTSLADHGWQVTLGPTANGAKPYCSEATAACPNQSLTIANERAGSLLLEFYDDPSSHRSAEMTNCAGGRDLSPCYYRLGHIAVAVRL